MELFFFKTFTINSPICHNMAIEFIKSDLTDHLGSIWNILLHKIAPYATCMKKMGIQINNTVYKTNRKNSPSSNVYYMEFYRNFLIEYSLIGIVKPKFTKRNEIWCKISEIEDLSKNVRKSQEQTSLSSRLLDHLRANWESFRHQF